MPAPQEELRPAFAPVSGLRPVHAALLAAMHEDERRFEAAFVRDLELDVHLADHRPVGRAFEIAPAHMEMALARDDERRLVCWHVSSALIIRPMKARLSH